MYKSNASPRRRGHEADVEASKPLIELSPASKRQGSEKSCSKITIMGAIAAVITLGLLATVTANKPLHSPRSCDDVQVGYQCDTKISHYWGQYSPYYSVPSRIPDFLPPGCRIDQVSILSRHGARDPTSSKTKTYQALVQKVQASVTNFPAKYAFLKTFKYTLGADQLTGFGQQEMVNSGIKFYDRYNSLTRANVPFVRASGEDRVIESAYNWTQGFNQANQKDHSAKHPAYPYPVLIIPEEAGENNTLNHDLCTAFETGPDSNTAKLAEGEWQSIFTVPIQQRLNNDLPGANLSQTDVVNFMSLCPFVTVASPTGQVSDFCGLFTENEWHEYDYFQSLDKYYGYGAGNALGPSQGVGYVNELLARLTGLPVQDETTSNHTLDSSAATFPLDRALYADFSHDNDMTGVFFALGLYNQTLPLSNSTLETVQQTRGYSASYSVPFAGRAYFERVSCGLPLRKKEEYVRVLINDRVIPLQSCKANTFGMCLLDDFVQSQSFARAGGKWDRCFT